MWINRHKQYCASSILPLRWLLVAFVHWGVVPQNSLMCSVWFMSHLGLHMIIIHNFVKLWQIYGISAIFTCFVFFSPKFAQILKYFAQLCDCMIAAFRKFGQGHYFSSSHIRSNCCANLILDAALLWWNLLHYAVFDFPLLLSLLCSISYY